jgi:hypothetical protein
VHICVNACNRILIVATLCRQPVFSGSRRYARVSGLTSRDRSRVFVVRPAQVWDDRADLEPKIAR